MGLLQGLLGLSGLIAGMGLGTGLVRLGAELLERQDEGELTALRRAAWRLFWLLGAVAASLLIVFRFPLSRFMLGGPEHGAAVVLLGGALLFNMASELQVGLLNAHQRVAALAKIGVLNSVLATSLAVGLVWRYGSAGIVAAVVCAPLIAWSVSRYFLRREVPRPVLHVPRQQVVAAGRRLLRFGAPYTLSLVVGVGVQLLIPILVLNTLGQAGVGYYRAAVTISITYLGFLLSAMALDYFPRVSALSAQPAQLVALINQQHRLVMYLGVPMILGMLALAPYLIPLVYSREFLPTVTIVEWQLIGDIVKFSSWTMAFVVLARCGSLTFFLTEVVGGVSYLVASWLGLHFFGLAGLGLGHFVSYLVYLLAVWWVLRREIGFRLSAENKRLAFFGLAAALSVHLVASSELGIPRLPLTLSITCLWGVASLVALWKELGAGYRVQTN